ncbi:MAG: hypothetical protein PHE61_00005, partial [Candidatus Omnitrophica bacterium]|nr:hypothetical protein [Candidatus Omnitrophota bacterium]
MNSRLIKIIAAVIVVCFSATTISWSAPLMPGAIPGYAPSGNLTPSAFYDPRTISIPKDFGFVDEVFSGPRGGLAVYIQDAHCNRPAQKKISEIIEYLSKRYFLSTIAVEGGSGEADLKPFRNYRHKDYLRLASDFLLHEALLSGSEYFTVLSDKNLRFCGIEDKRLYESNRRQYLEALGLQEKWLPLLNEREAGLNERAKKILPGKLWEMLKLKDTIVTSKDFLKPLGEFLKISEELEIDTGSFHELRAFYTLIYANGRINKTKLNQEIDNFIRKYPEHEDGLLSLKEKGEEPQSIPKVSALKLFNYPNLSRYIEYLTLKNSLNAARLFREISEVKNRCTEKLIRNDEDRVLLKELEVFQAVKRICELKATPADLDVLDRVLGTSGNVPGTGPARPVPGTLPNTLFQKALRFYKFAKKRDGTLARNFSKVLDRDKRAFLVTGGFHADGIKKRLRERGISYVVIVPRIEPDFAEEVLYRKRIGGDDSPLEAETVADPQLLLTEKYLGPINLAELAREKGIPVQFNPSRFAELETIYQSAVFYGGRSLGRTDEAVGLPLELDLIGEGWQIVGEPTNGDKTVCFEKGNQLVELRQVLNPADAVGVFKERAIYEIAQAVGFNNISPIRLWLNKTTGTLYATTYVFQGGKRFEETKPLVDCKDRLISVECPGGSIASPPIVWMNYDEWNPYLVDRPQFIESDLFRLLLGNHLINGTDDIFVQEEPGTGKYILRFWGWSALAENGMSPERLKAWLEANRKRIIESAHQLLREIGLLTDEVINKVIYKLAGKYGKLRKDLGLFDDKFIHHLYRLAPVVKTNRDIIIGVFKDVIAQFQTERASELIVILSGTPPPLKLEAAREELRLFPPSMVALQIIEYFVLVEKWKGEAAQNDAGRVRDNAWYNRVGTDEAEYADSPFEERLAEDRIKEIRKRQKRLIGLLLDLGEAGIKELVKFHDANLARTTLPVLVGMSESATGMRSRAAYELFDLILSDANLLKGVAKTVFYFGGIPEIGCSRFGASVLGAYFDLLKKRGILQPQSLSVEELFEDASEKINKRVGFFSLLALEDRLIADKKSEILSDFSMQKYETTKGKILFLIRHLMFHTTNLFSLRRLVTIADFSEEISETEKNQILADAVAHIIIRKDSEKENVLERVNKVREAFRYVWHRQERKWVVDAIDHLYSECNSSQEGMERAFRRYIEANKLRPDEKKLLSLIYLGRDLKDIDPSTGSGHSLGTEDSRQTSDLVRTLLYSKDAGERGEAARALSRHKAVDAACDIMRVFFRNELNGKDEGLRTTFEESLISLLRYRFEKEDASKEKSIASADEWLRKWKEFCVKFKDRARRNYDAFCGNPASDLENYLIAEWEELWKIYRYIEQRSTFSPDEVMAEFETKLNTANPETEKRLKLRAFFIGDFRRRGGNPREDLAIHRLKASMKDDPPAGVIYQVRIEEDNVTGEGKEKPLLNVWVGKNSKPLTVFINNNKFVNVDDPEFAAKRRAVLSSAELSQKNEKAWENRKLIRWWPKGMGEFEIKAEVIRPGDAIGRVFDHGNVATCSYRIENEFLEFDEFTVEPFYRNTLVFTTLFENVVRAVRNEESSDRRTLTPNAGNIIAKKPKGSEILIRFGYSAIAARESINGLIAGGHIEHPRVAWEFRLDPTAAYYALGPKFTGKVASYPVNAVAERELIRKLCEAAVSMKEESVDWEMATTKVGAVTSDLIKVIGISGVSFYTVVLDKDDGKYVVDKKAGALKFREFVREKQNKFPSRHGKEGRVLTDEKAWFLRILKGDEKALRQLEELRKRGIVVFRDGVLVILKRGEIKRLVKEEKNDFFDGILDYNQLDKDFAAYDEPANEIIYLPLRSHSGEVIGVIMMNNWGSAGKNFFFPDHDSFNERSHAELFKDLGSFAVQAGFILECIHWMERVRQVRRIEESVKDMSELNNWLVYVTHSFANYFKTLGGWGNAACIGTSNSIMGELCSKVLEIEKVVDQMSSTIRDREGKNSLSTLKKRFNALKQSLEVSSASAQPVFFDSYAPENLTYKTFAIADAAQHLTVGFLRPGYRENTEEWMKSMESQPDGVNSQIYPILKLGREVQEMVEAARLHLPGIEDVLEDAIKKSKGYAAGLKEDLDRLGSLFTDYENIYKKFASRQFIDNLVKACDSKGVSLPILSLLKRGDFLDKKSKGEDLVPFFEFSV